jgi:hypothetical protein
LHWRSDDQVFLAIDLLGLANHKELLLVIQKDARAGLSTFNVYLKNRGFLNFRTMLDYKLEKHLFGVAFDESEVFSSEN